MKNQNKKILLKGEGVHEHVLYGTFNTEEVESDFMNIEIMKDSLLKHEQPNGFFGEHQTLKIEQGGWIMGKQVEYNPFNQQITRIWD